MLENVVLIIDFDSTFIKVEAFDVLAEIVLGNIDNKENILKDMSDITIQGMEGKLGISESIKRRLNALKFNKSDLKILVEKLNQLVSTSILRNREFFKNYNEQIYIVSSGFKEYIIPVVKQFGIKESHILANNFIFDNDDNVIGLDESNPLAHNKGKVVVVKSLNLKKNIIVIGDGYTDFEIKKDGEANLFYAFIENVNREIISSKADKVIASFDEFLYLYDIPISTSYPKSKIKVLLLENINATAIKALSNDGFQIESLKGSLNENELIEKMKDIAVLGIRSKTLVTKNILDNAPKLMTIGAFCIGTNQIDLDYATLKGISVFNAPYSNTRSVVELVIGEIIAIYRKLIIKNNNLHNGIWDKSSDNCFEIRGKTLGIVGYGNIGSQLSVLAESLGLQVCYFDVIERLPLGNVKKCNSLEELLECSDIVSLHVDGRKENSVLIGEKELLLMKQDSILINLSRGHVVDLEALIDNLTKDKFLGVAIDVFPIEPKNNQEKFIHKLTEFERVILTPHIGGSTQEAQSNIGDFVSKKIINYINIGDTTQSVNFPNIQLPVLKDAHRFIHIHKNVPGILAQINKIFAENDINVLWQSLKTNENIGYIITDVNKDFDKSIVSQLKQINNTIYARVLY